MRPSDALVLFGVFTAAVSVAAGQTKSHPKTETGSSQGQTQDQQHAVQCSEECSDLYIGETKQHLHKRMAQHRRGTSTGPDSAVHLHLKEKGHSFEDANVHILDREDRWFERGVKEAIYTHCEQPSLNRGEGTVYGRVGGDVVLRPPANSVTEPITQILWKEGVNKAMEWDGGNSSVEYFRHFRERGHLSTTTGEMTIRKLMHNDTNLYTPEINNNWLPPVHLVVLSPVPLPTASASCDESACELTCNGNTTGAGTVTYTWMLDNNVVHVSSENQYTVHKDNSSSSIDFSCAMGNHISEQTSKPVPISFTPPPEKGPKISAGVTVLIVLLCVVLLLVAVHRWKAGTWFFEKDSMPWEADFWRKSESRRREAPASNGNPSHRRGENAEEEPMTAR